MDLVPWHSDKFDGLDFNRFTDLAIIEEAKEKVFLPAILNAINSRITQHANINKNNKVIFLCRF